MTTILSPRELEGFDAFIEATNEAGGVLGYERMLIAVVEMMDADHGAALTRACISRVVAEVLE